MAAPTVQTLQQALADMAPAYKEQENILNQQRAGLTDLYAAQKAGLEGQRSQAFDDIANAATGRGVGAAFSGIPIDEQARYLSNKFLPGMQEADKRRNQEDLGIRNSLAQLGTQKYQGALSRVAQQQQAFNQYNMQQERLAAQAREAQLNREAQAREGAANRAAQAARYGGGQVNLYDTIQSKLERAAAASPDGKVSPQTWSMIAQEAHHGGMKFSGRDGFANRFWAFANDSHWGDYKNGYERYDQ